MGLGFPSGKLIAMDQCLYDGPKLCLALIEFDNDNCMMGILHADLKVLAQCPTVPVHVDVVIRIGNGDLLLYTAGEALQKRCPGRIASSKEITLGTYECVMSSTQGWRYTVLNLKAINLTIEEV